jgi:hypothetical protein
MSIRTRMTVGLGAVAIGLGGIAAIASPAVATQAATQTEINGIVAATNAWTTQTQGYTYSEYTVGNIAVSSVNTSYARAQILPLAAYKNQISTQWVLLYGAGSQWTVVDGGQNFCDNVGMILAGGLVFACVKLGLSASQVFLALAGLVVGVVLWLRIPKLIGEQPK